MAVDGRLLLHEWIRTPRGLLKVDAIDHHCDHFMPGLTDAAWDVAALVVEAALDGSGRDVLVERYAARSADRTIAARLPFYSAAYLAFRTGYCAIAEASVPDDAERKRFARARGRYAVALRDALSGAPSAA